MRAPIKIALCLESPIGLQGGVSVLVQALAEGLREQYELVLVSPDTADDFAAANINSIFAGHIFWEPENISIATSKSLAEKLAQSGVALAHFHGGVFSWGIRFPASSPIFYARQRDIHVCTTTHLVGDWLAGFCGPQKSLWFKLLLLPAATIGKLHALADCEFEICVSKRDCHILKRRYWPLQNRFVQIYHSRLRADSAQFSAVARRKIILCVGHLARRKGQEILAEAFCKIAGDFSDWELWFAGPTLEEATPRRIQEFAAAANAGDRVKLLGQRLDAANLMREAAIYVQPSFLEGLPLALQEAMFYGCACIGSRIPGNQELISDESVGVLVEAGNVNELAGQLRRLMNSSEQREQLGRAAARSIIERNMTCESMICEHQKIYETKLRQ